MRNGSICWSKYLEFNQTDWVKRCWLVEENIAHLRRWEWSNRSHFRVSVWKINWYGDYAVRPVKMSAAAARAIGYEMLQKKVGAGGHTDNVLTCKPRINITSTEPYGKIRQYIERERKEESKCSGSEAPLLLLFILDSSSFGIILLFRGRNHHWSNPF